MQALSLVALACLAVSSCHASGIGISFGKCPSKDAMTDFEVSDYMGKWYEYKRANELFETFGKCVTADYTLNNETDVVTVVNSMYIPILKEKKTINGTAVLDSDTEAKLTVTFDVPIAGKVTAPYWVMATDYTEYAVVYSCKQLLDIFKFEFGWILTRSTSPSSSTLTAIEEALEKAGIENLGFTKTTQDCDN